MKKILLILANLLLPISCYLLPLKAQTSGLSNWMSKLPDNRMVCKLSIPGTHDASTGEGFTDVKFVDDYTTQVARLNTQLKGGIRYFDLRLIFNKNSLHPADTLLQISHRTASIGLTYQEVLANIASFLQKNPSEFIIIKIQYDGGTLSQKEQFTWNRLIQESLNSSLFTHNFRKDITVGEARGKILLLSRTPYGKTVFGALTGWGDEGTEDYTKADLKQECSHWLKSNTDSAHFYVQDYYNSIGSRMPAKLQAVEQMYLMSQQIPDNEPVWILNHTSGFSSPKMNAIGYAENASNTNKKLIELLSRKGETRPIGIIAMDYACIDRLNKKIGTLGRIKRDVMSKTLTRKIIARNFEK